MAQNIRKNEQNAIGTGNVGITIKRIRTSYTGPSLITVHPEQFTLQELKRLSWIKIRDNS